jgi:competence protein ComEC
MTDRKTSTNSIFVFLFGFFSGVLASSFVFIAPLIGALFILVALAVLSGEKILSSKINKETLFISLALFAFGFGALCYAVKDFHEPSLMESEGSLVGIVESEPEQKENTARFVMSADSSGEKVLVSTGLYSPVEYGDRVEVSGSWQEPGIIDDGVGRPFDYAAYLAKDDIYYTLSFAEVEILSSGHGNSVKQFLFKIKNSFVEKMKVILPEPESSLLAGLVVAGKGAMPSEIIEEFRRAGIIHIVVLSGYNVTIIAIFIGKIFETLFLKAPLLTRRFNISGPRAAAGASVVGIILFVFMTGAEATVVRASLMVLAVIAAKAFGKNYSASRALLLAAFLMVLINPKILVFDPSFQLSFLAMCGLIWLTPIFEKLLVGIKMPELWGTRIVLATTLATQFSVLPFLVYSMSDVSLVSLPANILVLLFIPSAMLAGFIAALIAYASPIIALPFSYVAHLILSWILGVSSVLGNLSFASIAVSQFPFLFVIVFYIAMIIFVRRQQISSQHFPNSN